MAVVSIYTAAHGSAEERSGKYVESFTSFLNVMNSEYLFGAEEFQSSGLECLDTSAKHAFRFISSMFSSEVLAKTNKRLPIPKTKCLHLCSRMRLGRWGK